MARTQITEAVRHLRGQVPLSEYFESEEDLHEVLSAMQVIVVRVFLNAKHPTRRQCTGKDHYIMGLDDKPSNLMSYVMERAYFQKVCSANRIPESARREMSKKQIEMVLWSIHANLVMMIINSLIQDHLLYRLNGDWCFTHEVRKEYDRLQHRAKDAFFDQRSWHGVPANQGRRKARLLRAAYPGARG